MQLGADPWLLADLLVQELCEQARWREWREPPRPERLAELLFGPGAVVRVPKSSQRAPAELRPGLFGTCVAVWARRPRERVGFDIGHELGHWAIWRLGLSRDETEEAVCNAVAAKLVCPDRAFRLVYARVGLDLRRLANEFTTTETCAALRVGEVTGRPICVFGAGPRRVRGAPFVWPERPGELEGLAARRAGVWPVELGDKPGRMMLMGT